MKGYKQTEEHIRKRIRKGQDHYRWDGDNVSVKGGRARALRTYPKVERCSECRATRIERHHIDGNTANNEPSNIQMLCRRCHMIADGRMDIAASQMREVQKIGIKVAANLKNKQTHCKRGHPLSGQNLFITTQGSRGCKECRRIHKRDYMARKNNK